MKVALGLPFSWVRGLILIPDKVNTEVQICPKGEFTRISTPELAIYDHLVLHKS